MTRWGWTESLYFLNQVVDSGSSGFILHNAVWGQEGYRFLSDYLNILDQDFEAELTAYAFKPLPQPEVDGGPIIIAIPPPPYTYLTTGFYWTVLDGWAEQVTAPNILNSYSVIQDDPERTRLAFANATTLAAGWPMALTPADSFEGLFETFEGIQYWVPVLRQQGTFGFYQDELLSAVDLPLGNGNQSLLLITPSAGNYEVVFNNLTQHLNVLIGLLEPTEMETFIPEFSFSDMGAVDGFLESVGFNEVYWEGYPGCTENCSPNFLGINGQGFLRLEATTRRSTLSFSSEMLDAASITTAVIEATLDEPSSFCCLGGGGGGFFISGGGATYLPEGQAHVKPFVFVIRDTQTGAILYMGQLTDAGGRQAGSWCLDGGGGGSCGGSAGGGGMGGG